MLFNVIKLEIVKWQTLVLLKRKINSIEYATLNDFCKVSLFLLLNVYIFFNPAFLV